MYQPGFTGGMVHATTVAGNDLLMEVSMLAAQRHVRHARPVKMKNKNATILASTQTSVIAAASHAPAALG